MNDNVIGKIQKLLALAADGKNEHEAQAALLKARELMAQHKISDEDVKHSDEPRKLNMVELEDQTYTGLKNTWKAELSNVIANYHCCGSVSSRFHGSTIRRIKFVGLDDDPAIASEAFKYAVDFIERKEKEERAVINARYANQSKRNEIMRQWAASYPRGFTHGLREQYEQQFKQGGGESFALVLVRPIEVKQYMDGLKTSKVQFRRVETNGKYVLQGYTDGKAFRPTKAIGGNEVFPGQMTIEDYLAE